MYDENSLLFQNGKHKNKPLSKVPMDYLINIYDHRSTEDEDLYAYIERNYPFQIKRPRYKWKKEDEEVSFICDKRAFATKEIARTKLKQIREKEQDNKKPIRVYECEKCSQWHLTSMPIEVFKSIK